MRTDARQALRILSTVPALPLPYRYRVQITVAMLRATTPLLHQYCQEHRHTHIHGLLLLRIVRLITVLVWVLTPSPSQMLMVVRALHQLHLSVLLLSLIFLSQQVTSTVTESVVVVLAMDLLLRHQQTEQDLTLICGTHLQ